MMVREGKMSSLSPRETEILSLVAEGLTNRQIAQRLGLSHRTVGAYLHVIYSKLGVSSRAAAVARYITELGREENCGEIKSD